MKPKIRSELSNSNASSIYEPSEQSSICSMDDSATEMAANDSSTTNGSFNFPLDELRRKYKREFRAAIHKNYKYIMNEDIIDFCFKLSESDHSASEDTSTSNNALSYHEFLRQYSDLLQRLHIFKHQLNNDTALSLSEKHLNKVYHEELLHRLTCRTQFKEYAQQLIIQYPSLKQDVVNKHHDIEALWNDLEVIVGCNNPLSLLEDIESDVSGYDAWLGGVEGRLSALEDALKLGHSLTVKSSVMDLNADIQRKSKWAPSIIHICQDLLTKSSSSSPASSLSTILSSSPSSSPLSSSPHGVSSFSNSPPSSSYLSSLPSSFSLDSFKERVKKMLKKAQDLQHRWEAVYIRCLEWQLKCEEPLRERRFYNSFEDEDEENVDKTFDESTGDAEDLDENLESFYDDRQVLETGALMKPSLPVIDEQTEDDTGNSDSAQGPNNLQSLSEDFFANFRNDLGYSSSDNCQIPLQESSHSRDVYRENADNYFNYHINNASDLSDSSGIVGTQSTNYRINSANTVSSNANASKQSGNYDSSLPATEDEFSVDDVPVYKEGEKPALTSDSKQRDVTKSYSADEGLKYLDKSLGNDFVILSDQEGLKRCQTPPKGTMVRIGCCDRLNEMTPVKSNERSPVKRNRLCLSSGDIARKCEKDEEEDDVSSVKRVRKIASCDGLHTVVSKHTFDFKRGSNVSRSTNVKRGIDFESKNESAEDGKEFEACDMFKKEEPNQQVSDHMAQDTDIDACSFQSEMDLSDIDSEEIRSNVDVWLEDNVWHSTPNQHRAKHTTRFKHRTFRTVKVDLNTDHPPMSDSDVEDFEDMFKEFTKALMFTRRSLKLGQGGLEENKHVLESLVTIQTSLRCLHQLTSASCSTSRKQLIDLSRVEALRDEWKELRDEVLHGETMSVEHLIEQVVKMKKEMDDSSRSVRQMHVKIGRLCLSNARVSITRCLIRILHGLQLEKKMTLETKSNLEDIEQIIMNGRLKKINDILNTTPNSSINSTKRPYNSLDTTLNDDNNGDNTNHYNCLGGDCIISNVVLHNVNYNGSIEDNYLNNDTNEKTKNSNNKDGLRCYGSKVNQLKGLIQCASQSLHLHFDNINTLISNIIASLDSILRYERRYTTVSEALTSLAQALNRQSEAELDGLVLNNFMLMGSTEVESNFEKMTQLHKYLNNAVIDDDDDLHTTINISRDSDACGDNEFGFSDDNDCSIGNGLYRNNKNNKDNIKNNNNNIGNLSNSILKSDLCGLRGLVDLMGKEIAMLKAKNENIKRMVMERLQNDIKLDGCMNKRRMSGSVDDRKMDGWMSEDWIDGNKRLINGKMDTNERIVDGAERKDEELIDEWVDKNERNSHAKISNGKVSTKEWRKNNNKRIQNNFKAPITEDRAIETSVQKPKSSTMWKLALILGLPLVLALLLVLLNGDCEKNPPVFPPPLSFSLHYPDRNPAV